MKKTRFSICTVTGTRAEYGLLKELLKKLKIHPLVDFTLVITGSHLSEKFGNTLGEIIKDGFNEYDRIDIPLENDSDEGMAITTGIAIEKFSEYFSINKFDVLIVLGDRYEVFAAAFAAHLIGIPIAHISGGDITEGAVDNTMRHCITKMSSLHFPGCELSAKRIIQLGEHPSTVFNVGELGIENCLKTELMSKSELSKLLRFDIENNDYAVVTFHPVTFEKDNALAQVNELIKAMDQKKNMAFIITMANADAGGRAINDIWLQKSKIHNNWLVVPSLGVLKYLSTVKNAKMVIGNSSSGIIEAPALGTPTINIGDRQKGRMYANSVISCDPTCEEIKLSIDKALSVDFQSNLATVDLPFGNGTTSTQIMNILLRFLSNGQLEHKKQFFDIYY